MEAKPRVDLETTEVVHDSGARVAGAAQSLDDDLLWLSARAAGHEPVPDEVAATPVTDIAATVRKVEAYNRAVVRYLVWMSLLMLAFRSSIVPFPVGNSMIRPLLVSR